MYAFASVGACISLVRLLCSSVVVVSRVVSFGVVWWCSVVSLSPPTVSEVTPSLRTDNNTNRRREQKIKQTYGTYQLEWAYVSLCLLCVRVCCVSVCVVRLFQCLVALEFSCTSLRRLTHLETGRDTKMTAETRRGDGRDTPTEASPTWRTIGLSSRSLHPVPPHQTYRHVSEGKRDR